MCNSLLVGLQHYTLAKSRCPYADFFRDEGTNASPILKNLHWLPVSQRITFKILTFAHRSIYGGGPLYLQLEISVPTLLTRHTSAPTLVQPLSNFKMAGDRAFSVAAPKLWNSVPIELRLIDKLSVFKADLKHTCSNNVFKLL